MKLTSDAIQIKDAFTQKEMQIFNKQYNMYRRFLFYYKGWIRILFWTSRSKVIKSNTIFFNHPPPPPKGRMGENPATSSVRQGL